MPPKTLASAQTVETVEAAPTKTTTPPTLLGCGLNWVSFVAAHPFEVKRLTSVRAGDDGEESGEHDALVPAQLPVASTATSRVALERIFGEVMVCPCAKAGVVREVQHIATVWCLHPSSVYAATLSWPTDGGDSASTETAKLRVQTEAWHLPLNLCSVSPHVLDRGSLVFHPEFARCILAQGVGEFMFYVPPDPLEPTTALPFIQEMWYHGLFSLPESLRIGPHSVFTFFVLPNGHTRYTLDLAPEPPAAPATASTSGHDGGASAPATCSDALTCLYPWRRQSKVRRIIRSGAYAVVVQSDTAGVTASLQRASSYHRQRTGSTWLSDAFIYLMGQCSGTSTSLSTDTAASEAAQNDKPHNVRLLCIELVEKATGEVLAGCCGISVGRAYHDYTMYTLRQSKDSVGTFLTKLIGEALQRCGYTLWYWGFRVEYMQQYERHLGAVDMPRDFFYRRWGAARDALPYCTLDAYLRSHKGMVSHYERVSTPPKRMR
ncbi:hypothetical protein LSCM1_03875 [Leishmania martiniquensis]|uniref:Uncharacterized protein n=1 Tax=Leishmania martiniquensis TaxID=1580590 RepID=A0A836KFU1_9TRYP|nr:hypothetical protein LSCM1_03875 [Leishmania martiniquensis]